MEGYSKSIKVYGRIKPYDIGRGSELVEYDIYDRVSVDSTSDFLKSKLVFNLKPSAEAVNNKVEQQIFRFCKVLDQDSQQLEIYENVAKPVVESVLEGYNGTIFAYGQTGSGKTFSITGGSEDYEERGIIPRSIQHVFESLSQMTADILATVFISYCEIYNETGYDLLDAGPRTRTRLEDLPRISISEDVNGNFHFRNLNVKKVESAEEALNLLFVGDSNRVTAETPTNKNSSRSHCVFTIIVTTSSDTTGIVRRSKLNLVDLAGSERVSKTCLNGRTLEEAKNINLSLHFLEQVIVALNTPDSKHIPYRNSIMTIILKDSLGGNCLTTMLATLSVELENIWETLSTCRFAQRVALIKNEVHVNEELDPQLEVKILKEDIKALKKQLLIVGAPSVEAELTPDEIGECHNLVREILSKETIESMPPIPADFRKINQCTWLLRSAVVEAGKNGNPKAKELVNHFQESEKEIASPRVVDGSILPAKQPCKRPSNQSATTKYSSSRSRAGSARSNSSHPRSSQQWEGDMDIAMRIEENMRRLASLRSLLCYTRSTNAGDDPMDEFIAGGIHQIHEDERDYRMLLALQYDQQTSEDLLMEQVEISKLKMLFDFRNMYQELASSVDGKSTLSFDQRSVGNKSESMSLENRSPRKLSPGDLGWGLGLPTLEEASVTNSAETVSLGVDSKIKESSVATARKLSTASTNKTDSALYGDSVQSDKANSSRKSSAVSQSSRATATSPRIAGQVSTNGTQSAIPVGNLSAHSDIGDTASRRCRSAGSTASRKPLCSDTKSNMSPKSNSPSNDTRSPQNASAMSTSPSPRTSLELQTAAGSRSTKSAMLVPLGLEADTSLTPDEARNYIDSIRLPSYIPVKSTTTAEEIPLDVYSKYPNSTCSEATRGSIFQQMGIGNFPSKSNPLTSALAVGNVFSLQLAATSSVPKGSDKSNVLITETADGSSSQRSNDINRLQQISNMSTATKGYVGPQSRRVSWSSNAPPFCTPDGSVSEKTGLGSVQNASVTSTATVRTAGPPQSASRMSTTSNAMPRSSAIPVNGNNKQNSVQDALKNSSVVSTATVKSLRPQSSCNNPVNSKTVFSSENYETENVTIPKNIDTTCVSINPDQECTNCPVVNCTENATENVLAASVMTSQPAISKASTTTTRESIGRPATSDVLGHKTSASSVIVDILAPSEDVISLPDEDAAASLERYLSSSRHPIDSASRLLKTSPTLQKPSGVSANEPNGSADMYTANSSVTPGINAIDNSNRSSTTTNQRLPIISMHSSGAASATSNSGTSPRVARRLSSERSSASQGVGPKIPMSQNATGTNHPAENDPMDPSMQTIYKHGSIEVPQSINTFQPGNDMQQCEEDNKCLDLFATKRDFEDHFGLPRPEYYSSMVTVTSKGTVTDDLLGCDDVIPCTSSEFPFAKATANGGTISTYFANAIETSESLQSNTTPPALCINFEDSAKPNVAMVYIEDLCLTGDPEIDEEIIEFYKARNRIG